MEATNNMLRSIKEANTSVLTISKDVIEQAVEDGILSKIGEHHKGKTHNVYYEIEASKRDDVLMHIQDDMYIIISRYIICIPTGEIIDTLRYLLRYSFCIGRTSENRCHVMASCPKDLRDAGGFGKTLYLTRLFIALEQYGVLINPEKDYDVHHKGDCFDNRQFIIRYIPRVKHKHRKSHMTGFAIISYDFFKKYLVYIDQIFKVKSMVMEIE